MVKMKWCFNKCFRLSNVLSYPKRARVTFFAANHPSDQTPNKIYMNPIAVCPDSLESLSLPEVYRDLALGCVGDNLLEFLISLGY